MASLPTAEVNLATSRLLRTDRYLPRPKSEGCLASQAVERFESLLPAKP